MLRAKLTLDRAYAISEIDPRIYGSFLEHLGRAIYGGIYEPGHPSADARGFRRDVLGLVKALRVPVTRYPGGNFVSGFDWEDSVGPVEKRRHRLDLAWFTTETNEFGLHEFLAWCKEAETQPMYAINLGTRGADAARGIVEYCNHPGGSHYSDLRIKHGAKDPLGIKLWCLGNEMDGPWQIAGKTAHEYGRAANEAAKVMKWVDPSIELVACGSSAYDMPTFGDWELTMLNECYDNVDYVSLHRYYGNRDGDSRAYLARALDMDDFIKAVASLCDAARARKRSRKRLNLSFDEWNVWYHSNAQDAEVTKQGRWGRALPLLEDVYNLEDALLVGSLLITLLKNADRVKIACMAQLVNVIAPVMTRVGGGAWAQTTYWPLMHASTLGRGTALRAVVESPTYACADYDHVPELEATATMDEHGSVTVFAVNRSTEQGMHLSADLRDFAGLSNVRHEVLTHPDLKAVNTEDNAMNVAPRALPGGTLDGGRLEIDLPRQSWNVIRITK